MHKFALAVALTTALITPTLLRAQDAAPAAAVAPMKPKVGAMIRDKDGRRVGAIDSIRDDGGYVTVISDMSILHVPIATLSTGQKGLQTSLALADIRQ